MIIIDNACRPDGLEALKLFKHMELLFFFAHLQIPTRPVGVNVFLLLFPWLFLMARPPSPSPSSSLLGPGSHPCTLLMCHSHRQEPLELFCESCDLLCCSSCHLSSHKNHRSVGRYAAQGHGGAAALTAG